ncbi:response regulator [Halovulum sp. GXIMD14794]
MKVLAVDDTLALRAMLTDCLKGAGHTVSTASDGHEALGVLRTDRPDIVITDLNMPVMDGLDFLAKARRDPAGRGLPILLLTSETSPDLRRRAEQLRATGWLPKPFDPAQILSLVAHLG